MSDPTRRLGLVADPDLPADLAEHLVGQLPAALSRLDGSRDWEVAERIEALGVGASDDGSAQLRALAEDRRRHGWTLVIGVTDLPLRAGTRAIAAELVPAEGVALVSVPALGAVRLPDRAVRAAVLVLTELCAGAPPPSDGELALVPADGPGERRWLVVPGRRGQWRLFAGMVRANRPWRLVGGLSSTLLAAFATSAFGLFIIVLWQLADRLGGLRLSLATVVAVAAMLGYLIWRHELWEHGQDAEERRLARLYNATTLITLLVGVAVFYVALFVALALSLAFLVDPAFLEKTLGHPVGPGVFLRISWLIASVAAVGGALGSGTEDVDAVRRAAYGARQRARAEQRAKAAAEASAADAR